MLRKCGARLGARELRGVVAAERRRAADEALRVDNDKTQRALETLDTTLVLGAREALTLPSGIALSGEALWNSARVTRGNSHVRRAFRQCVVGGEAAVKRIWHEYKVRPTCLFVPDDVDVPEWCHDPEHPTIVVRGAAMEINTDLLSANYADGYVGAVFPMPIEASPLDLVDPSGAEANEARADLDVPEREPVAFSSVVALHRVANPANVGMILRAAVDMGYDAVVLDRCADVYNEKVLRASEGAAFSRTTRCYALNERNSDPVELLQRTAVSHRLFPIFAVPDTSADPVFSVAQRLHRANARAEGSRHKLGSMVVLGSEANGLEELEERWAMPAKAACVQMDNALVGSMNVAFAASIMLHHFRPAAVREFEDMFARGIVPEDDEEAADPVLLEARDVIAAGGTTQ